MTGQTMNDWTDDVCMERIADERVGALATCCRASMLQLRALSWLIARA